MSGEIPTHFSQPILLYQENVSLNVSFQYYFGSWRKPQRQLSPRTKIISKLVGRSVEKVLSSQKKISFLLL